MWDMFDCSGICLIVQDWEKEGLDSLIDVSYDSARPLRERTARTFAELPIPHLLQEATPLST